MGRGRWSPQGDGVTEVVFLDGPPFGGKRDYFYTHLLPRVPGMQLLELKPTETHIRQLMGRAKALVQSKQTFALLDYNFSNNVNRKAQVDVLRSKWPSAAAPSQLRITCVTVVPKLGEVQCNWKLQWSLAQRHAHNATAMLHPPYPDQCSSSYYAESIKWGDKRTAKEHTSAKVDEGFDGVFEVAAEFAHALANKLETDAMLLQWSAAFECTGGVATLRPSVGKAIKIWTKHRPLGRVIVILSSNAIAFAASEMQKGDDMISLKDAVAALDVVERAHMPKQPIYYTYINESQDGSLSHDGGIGLYAWLQGMHYLRLSRSVYIAEDSHPDSHNLVKIGIRNITISEIDKNFKTVVAVTSRASSFAEFDELNNATLLAPPTTTLGGGSSMSRSSSGGSGAAAAAAGSSASAGASSLGLGERAEEFTLPLYMPGPTASAHSAHFAGGDRMMGYVCSSADAMAAFALKCKHVPSPRHPPGAVPLRNRDGDLESFQQQSLMQSAAGDVGGIASPGSPLPARSRGSAATSGTGTSTSTRTSSTQVLQQSPSSSVDSSSGGALSLGISLSQSVNAAPVAASSGHRPGASAVFGSFSGSSLGNQPTLAAADAAVDVHDTGAAAPSSVASLLSVSQSAFNLAVSMSNNADDYNMMETQGSHDEQARTQRRTTTPAGDANINRSQSRNYGVSHDGGRGGSAGAAGKRPAGTRADEEYDVYAAETQYGDESPPPRRNGQFAEDDPYNMETQSKEAEGSEVDERDTLEMEMSASPPPVQPLLARLAARSSGAAGVAATAMSSSPPQPAAINEDDMYNAETQSPNADADADAADSDGDIYDAPTPPDPSAMSSGLGLGWVPIGKGKGKGKGKANAKPPRVVLPFAPPSQTSRAHMHVEQLAGQIKSPIILQRGATTAMRDKVAATRARDARNPDIIGIDRDSALSQAEARAAHIVLHSTVGGSGTEVYNCTAVIRHADGHLASSSCDCPFTADQCKHAVAMLLLYCDDPDRFHGSGGDGGGVAATAGASMVGSAALTRATAFAKQKTSAKSASTRKLPSAFGKKKSSGGGGGGGGSVSSGAGKGKGKGKVQAGDSGGATAAHDDDADADDGGSNGGAADDGAASSSSAFKRSANSNGKGPAKRGKRHTISGGGRVERFLEQDFTTLATQILALNGVDAAAFPSGSGRGYPKQGTSNGVSMAAAGDDGIGNAASMLADEGAAPGGASSSRQNGGGVGGGGGGGGGSRARAPSALTSTQNRFFDQIMNSAISNKPLPSSRKRSPSKKAVNSRPGGSGDSGSSGGGGVASLWDKFI